MHINADACWVARAGYTADEYEDAAWPVHAVSGDFATFRTAVADGATETSFSGLWAEMLVQAYRRGYFERHELPSSLSGLQQRWKKKVTRKPLPWYAEQKLLSGAFAALVGLTLTGKTDTAGQWRATAVGDCCVFQVRDRDLIVRFPVQDAQQFDSRPMLVSSNRDSNCKLAESTTIAEGEWRAGDAFYLMSDAIACWLLKAWQLRDADPLDFLQTYKSLKEFQQFIELQRNDLHEGSPMLKNDDVTVVRCTVGTSHAR